jgi:PEP-CTERM motif
MIHFIKHLGFAFIASCAAAIPAHATTQIFSTGYDTPNGDGQASTGTYNYWDKNYSGAGATTTDGAALTGGSGDLTDGVVATDFWYNVENVAGTGPYVGWVREATLNPLVTFYFAGSPAINAINIHLDNSGAGGVFSPSSIFVDGIAQAFTGPALGSIGWASIGGLNLTGGSHTIQFNQGGPTNWTFVSEVTFSGAIPEPASWAMMIAGFGLVGAAMRRRPSSRAANA